MRGALGDGSATNFWCYPNLSVSEAASLPRGSTGNPPPKVQRSK